ncbi:MAG: T9SS type A sorting domain-containing protein [Flavobacteriales bacterium]
MNTRTLVLHCTLLAVSATSAQTTALWGRKQGQYGGTFGVCTDQYSNVYGTGFITSPASFDTLVFACEPVDPFVVKYNTDGALQWAHTVPPGGGNAKAIAVDADGNSLVAGQFGGNQVCARYDASGTLLWQQGFTPMGSGYMGANSAALDDAGNIYLSGFFSGDLILDNDTLHPASWNAASDDIFLMKLTSTGQVLWVTEAGGKWGGDDALGLAVDANGNAAITGRFQDTAYFQAETIIGNDPFMGGGGYGVFFAKYDPNGGLLWVNGVASGGPNDGGVSIVFDDQGNLLSTGVCSASIAYFDTLTYQPANGQDMFLVKFDADGHVEWIRNSGGNGGVQYDAARTLAIHHGNQVVTAGAVAPITPVFGGISLAPVGDRTMFLAGYDTNGNVAWAKTYELGIINSAVSAPDNTLIIGGTFGVALFGAIVHLDTVALVPYDRTAFVAKMAMSDLSTGSTELIHAKGPGLSPVPASDVLMINLSVPTSRPVATTIMDASGRIVWRVQLMSTVSAIDVSAFANGHYTLHTNDGGTARFIVQH